VSELRDLPDSWRWAELGAVATVASNLVDPSFYPDLPHIAPNHIESQTGRLLPWTTVAGDGVTSSKHLFQPGQVLYSKIRPYLAKATLAPFKGLCSADMYPLDTELNSRFLLYWLLTKDFTQHASLVQGRTVLPKINREQLDRLPAPVAPLAEQDRIVAVIEEQFSRLDAGVAALERVRQNLKRLRAAIFEAAVTEWVGEGFPQICLGEVLREPLRNGHSSKADPLGSVPILTLTAVTLGDFGSHNVKMTAADPRRVRDLWIQPGDLLIERSNTRELVGTACLYRGRPNLAVYPDLLIRARVDGRVMSEYAELVLKSPRSRRYFQQKAQGISGTMPKIDQRTIENLSFTLPSLEVQAVIVEKAERELTLLDSLQMALKLATKRSSGLRSSILAAAFSGKLIPQDASDEPASVLLERIAAERVAANGHKSTRTLKPRISREKVSS
jgi:type I restriction enzyme S subunit